MRIFALVAIALLAVLAFGWIGTSTYDALASSDVAPFAQEDDDDKGDKDKEKKNKDKNKEKDKDKEKEKAGESPEDLAQKRRGVERKLEIARLKMDQARMSAESARISAELAVRHAKTEHDLAVGKMTQYLEIDSKNKIEQAELSLRGAKDRAREAAEELAQIEMMYEGQDLDDRTAEFVINRGKRNAERAARQIGIQERSLAALSKHEVPREIRRMELDVHRKKAAVQKAERELRATDLKNKIAILTAESALVGHEEELAKLDKKASKE